MSERIQPAVTRPLAPPAASRARPAPAGADFGHMLAHELRSRGDIKLSAHAQTRLQESRRQLSPNDMARIAEAVDRAQGKGARESLVLLNDLALVVSIRNRTVITAVGGERMKENIFTNIDSAVIL